MIHFLKTPQGKNFHKTAILLELIIPLFFSLLNTHTHTGSEATQKKNEKQEDQVESKHTLAHTHTHHSIIGQNERTYILNNMTNL